MIVSKHLFTYFDERIPAEKQVRDDEVGVSAGGKFYKSLRRFQA